MDKEYIQTYKENLRKRSLEEMKAKLDIRGEKRKLLLQLVIGAILTGIVIVLGYLGLSKDKNVQNAIYTAIWIGTLTPVVIIFIGIVIGAKILSQIPANLVRIAAQQDFEQKETIRKLSSRNDKISITNFSYYDPANPEKFKTGITIYNENSIPFTDVVIKLIETNWRKLDQDGNVFVTEKIGVLADNSHFKNWANRNVTSIGAKDNETIYFHQVENGIAVALLESRNEEFRYTDYSKDGKAIGFLEIIFAVRGNIGDEFFEKKYAQLIEYRSTKIKTDPNDVLIRISTLDCRSVIVCDSDIIEIA